MIVGFCEELSNEGMKMYRTGIGWDVHVLEEGRELVLGCVRFPEEKRGLKAHSDGDVVCHAICDAVLGAAALGDIGEHFPDTDEAYRGYPGARFLERVREKIDDAFVIVNVDCVIMSDAVRIGARKREMANAIATHLAIDPENVGVKATTWEGHGAVGRGEVIACQAVVTLHRRP